MGCFISGTDLCIFFNLHFIITGNRPLDFSQTKAQNLICGGQDCSPDSLQAQIKVKLLSLHDRDSGNK